jgi:hypothetical protein
MPRTPDIKDAIINQIVIGLGSTVVTLAKKKLFTINTTLKIAFFILVAPVMRKTQPLLKFH